MNMGILVSASKPEQVFIGCGDLVTLKKKRIDLMKILHPDVNKDPKAPDAVANINRLFDEAVKLYNVNAWTGTSERNKILGKLAIRYLREKIGDYGVEYITSKKVAYIVPKEYTSICADSIKIVGNTLKFISGGGRPAEDLKKHIPSSIEAHDHEGSTIMIVGRNPAGIALDDVISNIGFLPAEHAAWIMGSLYSFCCHLKTWDISHNGLVPHNIFIVPETHVVQVIGGWGFYSKIGSKLKFLPATVKSVAGNYLDPKKTSIPRIDLEMIKHVGRYILGDESGSSYKTPVSKELRMWLMLPAGNDALKEYAAWEKCRESTFGRPKFVKLELSALDVYN